MLFNFRCCCCYYCCWNGVGWNSADSGHGHEVGLIRLLTLAAPGLTGDTSLIRVPLFWACPELPKPCIAWECV